ncbi:MAG: LptF/LptG family permease [Bacteroides sp.]|nr:LptF/LptG family permease [Bacteroides sp.]MCM1413722.1 LptF/LptG family permease [Bacteroides sp.]MCM1471901.1 LptF/LptG family permease [Bacteroides sp.]
MLRVKRLYTFVLQSFLPLFVMTFFICLFIVLMQFLWRYIDDLVGKGLGIDVLGELFFYAALTMIPMALPLAILLASLMTFGNLGEHFELTAMKASGVSLIRVMRPLIILMVFIAVGAFFFQNNVLPIAQTKMYTLLYSMKQKSPELEIPEGVFYDQIPGYNLFVESKNRDNGMLYGVMIYDMSKGFDNANIILSDSGKLAMMDDKQHLYLQLWNGESFENLRDANRGMKNVPYRRESFTKKDILVKFDANFNRMDEEGMRNQYVGKNISELRETIDSLNLYIDSVGTSYGTLVAEAPTFGLQYYRQVPSDTGMVRQKVPDVKLVTPMNVDSLFKGASAAARAAYLRVAINKATSVRQDHEFRGLVMKDERKLVRRHDIEMQRKFTLSFACIIFFFIGAPLGAIIRKGGLGTPLVISVLLFIFYYIIDNTGYKMARDGKVVVWAGIWLSSAVLLPLGIFFTYKAVHDSALFNKDAYLNFFRRLIGSHQVRHIVAKETVIEDVDNVRALESLTALQNMTRRYLEENAAHPSYLSYWIKGYDREGLKKISAVLESTVEYLSNTKDKLIVNKLMDYPMLRSLWLYHPTGVKAVAWAAIIIFPIGLPVYLIGRHQLRLLRDEIKKIDKVSEELKQYYLTDETEEKDGQ